MGPWLIGVLLGYVFYKLKNRKIAINDVCKLKDINSKINN